MRQDLPMPRPTPGTGPDGLPSAARRRPGPLTPFSRLACEARRSRADDRASQARRLNGAQDPFARRHPPRAITAVLVVALVSVAPLTHAVDDRHEPDTRPAAATVPAADPQALAAFRRECAARFAGADGGVNMAFPGREGWLFFASEFRPLSVGRFWGPDAVKANRLARPEYADPLPAILDFKDQLARAGVELVLVPVPPKAAVHPDKVSDAVKDVSGRVDPDDVAFYDLLRKEGVRVIDLVPEFVRQAREHPDDDPYCRQDTHWSGRGCILAAQIVAAEGKGRPWLKDVKRQAFDAETKPVEITGDLFAAVRPPPTAPKERVPLRFVGTRKDGRIEPVE